MQSVVKDSKPGDHENKSNVFHYTNGNEFENQGIWKKHKEPDAGQNDAVKQPYDATTYSTRGVWDLTNLFQFTPYESGYCFLAVLNGPSCMYRSEKSDGTGSTVDKSSYNYYLQKAFIRMLEDEFKGLDGLEDMSVDTYEVSDGISSTTRIGKVNLPLAQTVSMKYTEKTGSLITKYLTTYLKTVKDPRSQARCYAGSFSSFRYEVFNMLYVITDSTCLRVEKAFLLLNAYPTTSPLGDMYNVERGEIGSKELSISFNANVVEGGEANRIAKSYLETLINTTTKFKPNKINLNSEAVAYSFHDSGGNRGKTNDLNIKINNEN